MTPQLPHDIRNTDLEDLDIGVIIDVLKAADDAYYNHDTELLDDAEYDAIKRHATSIDPRNEYFLAVGSDVRGGKVKLPNPMGSLTQLYTDDDIQSWVKKHNLRDASLVVTEKLDGVSCSLYFNANGDLRIAYSRGNGFEGADITRHVKKLVPGVANGPMDVRAEIIISKENFQTLKKLIKRSDGSEYKNPRNMVAGLMNSSVIDPVAYQYIDVVAYHDWNSTDSKSEQLSRLQQEGFIIPNLIVTTNPTDQMLTSVLNLMRKESHYEIDGIVVEVNDADLRSQMNPSTTTLNPEYARKFKVADASNNAIATVDYVEWRLAKTGYIKPRVHLIPFDLDGVTISHTTGFNAKFIVDNLISAGAKVHMQRAGSVIPDIVGVTAPGTMSKEEILEDIGEIGEWKWTVNDAGENVDAVLVGDHEDVLLKKAEFFFTALEVDGLKEGTLRKIFDSGMADTLEDIITLLPMQLCDAIGSKTVGEKIFKSMRARLAKVTLPQFMAATGFFGRGIGVRKLSAVYDALGSAMLDATVDQLVSVDGWDVKSANKFVHGLPAYKAFFDAVSNVVSIVEPTVVDGKLNGQVFVFTGFRDKSLKERLENAGGTVVDSFSKKVTCVIAADPNENSGKIKKARDAGIRIIGVSDVQKLMEE